MEHVRRTLPPHFWKSTSGRGKYNHWQHTFNAWVDLEGSAPSIQIMKNILEKIKKCVKSGSNSFKALVPALYEIACYITSTTCTAGLADKNQCSQHTQFFLPPGLPFFDVKGAPSKHICKDDVVRDAKSRDYSKNELSMQWFTGQPPEKHLEQISMSTSQILSTDLLVDRCIQPVQIEMSDALSSGATEAWQGRSCSSLDNVGAQLKSPYVNCSDDLGFDLRSLPSLTSSEIESLGIHLLPS